VHRAHRELKRLPHDLATNVTDALTCELVALNNSSLAALLDGDEGKPYWIAVLVRLRAANTCHGDC
jgi:hypothetical protein